MTENGRHVADALEFDSKEPATMSPSGYIDHLQEHGEIISNDLRYIRAVVPAGARLLDIGAGRGSFVLQAIEQGFQAYGLEVQPEAQQTWCRTGVPGVVADGFRTPFRESCFDVVRLKEVIEHVEDSLALVREARRLLKSGGYLIAHVPTPWSQFYPVANFWDDYTHVRPYSRNGLRRLMTDGGLELVSIRGYMSGRNAIEQLAGKVISLVLPHIYLVVARSTLLGAPSAGR